MFIILYVKVRVGIKISTLKSALFVHAFGMFVLIVADAGWWMIAISNWLLISFLFIVIPTSFFNFNILITACVTYIIISDILDVLQLYSYKLYNTVAWGYDTATYVHISVCKYICT